MLPYEIPDDPHSLVATLLRRVGIYRCGLQQLTCGIHYRYLRTGPIARINTQHHFAFNRRLQKKIPQVLLEYSYGVLLRLLRQHAAHLPLYCRRQKPLVSVFNSKVKLFPEYTAILSDETLADSREQSLVRPQHLDFQLTFGFSPVYRQDPVGRNTGNLLFVVIVIFIL